MSIDIHPNWTAAGPRRRAPQSRTVAARAPAPTPDGDPLAGLPPRVAAVARLVGRGMANAEVGDVLGITESTIKNHLTTAYRRLGLKGRGEYPSRRLCFLVGYWEGRTAREEA